MPRNYVSLRQLVEDWAYQSGEFPSIVLNNLCAQEAQGRFPDETFVDTRKGLFIRHGCLGKLVDDIRSAPSFLEREEIKEWNERLFVVKEGIIQFCEAYGVCPPNSVAPRRRAEWNRKSKHLAPPPYPATPEEIATEEEKQREAEAQQKALYEEAARRDIEKSLDRMRYIVSEIAKLNDLIAENKRYDYERRWWRCESAINGSLNTIHDSRYTSTVTQETERLISEFDAFLARGAERDKSENDASREEPDRKTEPPVKSTISAETCARNYLKRQVAAGNRLLRSKHFELAKKECGENLAERGFDRAWKEIAPPAWKKPGRPKREDDDHGSGDVDSK
jgi:hypothetical protein